MPNWCSNALGVTGPAEAISEFVEAIKNPDGTPENENEWDITRPCPMPEILRGTRSPSQSVEAVEEEIARLIAQRDAGGLQAHKDYTKEITEGGSWVTDEYLQKMRDQAQRSVDAHAETGYHEWYRWACDHWGTKWAPHVNWTFIEDTSIDLRFDSAWAPPSDLIDDLSSKFPLLMFILEYSEPGMGFLGAEAYQNGQEVASHHIDDASDDAVMKGLNAKIEVLQGDPDYDGDEEEELFDQIQMRWTVLQERCGADVSEAVTA